jgi:hypothetical protein
MWYNIIYNIMSCDDYLKCTVESSDDTRSCRNIKRYCPSTGLAGPWVPGRLRLLGSSRLSALWRWQGPYPYAPAAFTPQEFSWYSFLEAESTTGHVVPLVASEKIPSDITGDRSRYPPTSSVVPWPLRYPRPSQKHKFVWISTECVECVWLWDIGIVRIQRGEGLRERWSRIRDFYEGVIVTKCK